MRIIHIPILLLILACGASLAQNDDELQTLGEEDNLFPLDNPNTEDDIQESWIDEQSEITKATSIPDQEDIEFKLGTTEAYQTEDEVVVEEAQIEEETTTTEDTFGVNSDVESMSLFSNTNETESGNDAEIVDGSDNIIDYNDISENIELTTPTNDEESIDIIVGTGDELIVDAAQNEEENTTTENNFETSNHVNENYGGINAEFIAENGNEIENIELTTSANDDLIKINSGDEIIEELPHNDEENTVSNDFEVSEDSEEDVFSTNISTSDKQRDESVFNYDMKFESEDTVQTTPTTDDLILSMNMDTESEQTTEKSKNDEETITPTMESYSFDESTESETTLHESDVNVNFNVDLETEQTTLTNDDLVISVDLADEAEPIDNEENAEIVSNSFNENIDSEISFSSTSLPVYEADTENEIQSQTETGNTTPVEEIEAQQTDELPNAIDSVAIETQSNRFEEIINPELTLPPTDIETSGKKTEQTFVPNNVDEVNEGLKEPSIPTNVRSSKTIIDPSSIPIAGDVHVDAIDVVVGETKSELNTGGVSKSLIGMIVAGMIVVVALITVKRNWSSITKRFGSRSPTTNGRAGEQMNGKTPEEQPLKEKLPV